MRKLSASVVLVCLVSVGWNSVSAGSWSVSGTFSTLTAVTLNNGGPTLITNWTSKSMSNLDFTGSSVDKAGTLSSGEIKFTGGEGSQSQSAVLSVPAVSLRMLNAKLQTFESPVTSFKLVVTSGDRPQTKEVVGKITLSLAGPTPTGIITGTYPGIFNFKPVTRTIAISFTGTSGVPTPIPVTSAAQ